MGIRQEVHECGRTLKAPSCPSCRCSAGGGGVVVVVVVVVVVIVADFGVALPVGDRGLIASRSRKASNGSVAFVQRSVTRGGA